MRIAIVYNRESRRVINLFGIPNREHYGLKAIKRISDALKSSGHIVKAMEGDKDLIDRLEDFMPSVLKGERPGIVFNLSYGIQGQARYTHVPSMLEMAGIPYVGSGPLAHSLALDKVVAKMLFKQHGLPTPDFFVMQDLESPIPEIKFPLIVKPKNEALSFGIKVVKNKAELLEASKVILEEFKQPVLVEQFIDGREINVGILGNQPVEALPPAELDFGTGPNIYTLEDKRHESGRNIDVISPAKLTPSQNDQAQKLAIKAFSVLGCYDCARIDMQMDKKGNFYILEVNSLPSLGEHGSYVQAAEAAGLDFKKLVNRLVDVATARYFGMPSPPEIATKPKDPTELVFKYIIERRDRIEKRLSFWTGISSRTNDPVGIQMAVKTVKESFEDIGLKASAEFSNDLSSWCWQTKKGFSNGTLFIGHLDVPLALDALSVPFRRDPESLYGEGVGTSRGPLVMMEHVLRALKHAKLLHKLPLGVFYYTDEGRDARYSSKLLVQAAKKAKQVFILYPGNLGDRLVTQRRGRRKYSLKIEGKSLRPAQSYKKMEPLVWLSQKIKEISLLSSKKEKLSISPVELKTAAFPMKLPHSISVTLILTYLNGKKADALEQKLRALLQQNEYRWSLTTISDRPPFNERKNSLKLADSLKEVAKAWDISLATERSIWPSVSGLIPKNIPTVCGIGPVAQNLNEPTESIQRISLFQRTLLMTEFLTKGIK